MSIPVAPELYCFWNTETLVNIAELEQRGKSDPGFLRGDLLTKDFLKFSRQKNLLQKYG